MSSQHRDLSESMALAYDRLRDLRNQGRLADMPKYVASLNGGVTEEERSALKRWIQAETCEPVLRRWKLVASDVHDRLASDVIVEMRRTKALTS